MPRDNSDLDPALLLDLDEELNFVKQSRRNKFMPRVQVDKGHAWLVRFLPIQIGANNSWFGRIAQHWVNNRPIFCRRLTSAHMGGDPNYACPICAFVEKAVAHQSKDINDRAAKCGAEPKWFTACLVFGKDTGRSTVEYVADPECWTVYECSMYRGTFELLTMLYKRNAVKDTQGILDIYSGTDVWISRTGRGTTLQPDAQSPLVKKDPSWDDARWEAETNAVVEKVWKTLVLPVVDMPTDQQEQEQLLKIKEFVIRGSGAEPANNRGGGGRGGPAPRGEAPRGSRDRPAAQHPQDLDEASELGSPAQDFDLPAARPPARQPEPQRQAPAARPAPQGPPRASPPSVAKAPPAARPAQAPPQPAALLLAGIRGATPDEEDEDLASERQDLAPPMELPLDEPEAQRAPAALPAELPPLEPPPTPTSTTRLGGKLSASLSRLSRPASPPPTK